MRLKSLGKEVQSDFQHVRVIETAPFGKTLVLDHKTQSSQHDEHVYHETLVHPTMLAHPNPKRVYIGGGGRDGDGKGGPAAQERGTVRYG